MTPAPAEQWPDTFIMEMQRHFLYCIGCDCEDSETQPAHVCDQAKEMISAAFASHLAALEQERDEVIEQATNARINVITHRRNQDLVREIEEEWLPRTERAELDAAAAKADLAAAEARFAALGDRCNAQQKALEEFTARPDAFVEMVRKVDRLEARFAALTGKDAGLLGMFDRAGLLISALLSDGRADHIPNHLLDECERWSEDAMKLRCELTPARQDAEGGAEPQDKQCQNCGEQNHVGNRQCWRCTVSFEPAPPDPPTEHSKEWWMERARAEGDATVGAIGGAFEPEPAPTGATEEQRAEAKRVFHSRDARTLFDALLALIVQRDDALDREHYAIGSFEINLKGRQEAEAALAKALERVRGMAIDCQSMMEERDAALERERGLREIGSLAAKVCVMVLGAYQRDNDGAMRAFGSNGAAHVANELGGKLMRFKIQHPPQDPALAAHEQPEGKEKDPADGQ